MTTTVSIIKITEDSNLFEAIYRCIDLLGTERILQAKTILLKPNCLQDNPDAATDPEILRNTIKVIQKLKAGQNYELLLGDSPGLLTKKARIIFENLGFIKIAEDAGVQYVEFDGGEPPIHIEIPDATRLKETTIAPIVNKVDLIVNLPRLKTHVLTVYTGAVKNYWGVQPGGIKARNHLKGTSTEAFSEVITDLYSYLANKPQLIIMGGKGMEGSRGPSSGPMKPLNFILGGFDPVAVDAVAVTLVGHNPLQEVPHIRMCTDRNLGEGNIEHITIVGSPISEVTLTKPFSFPFHGVSWVGGLFGPIVYRYTKKIPRLRRKECIKCGNCAKICPGEAITLNPYPVFHRNKCIQCLCCVETCPKDALRVGIAGLGGILGIS